MAESIGVLITCHNRREQTLACLESLHQQDHAPDLHVYLVDDGSTDGTAAVIRSRFPKVSIMIGSGSLYWTGGMRLAYERASKEDHAFHLWLNDDVVLVDDAVARLVQCWRTVTLEGSSRTIVVGSLRDPITGFTTYGGRYRPDPRKPTRFELIDPADQPITCEVMNGNVVLVPREVNQLVGNLDGVFTHGMADFDYALRARKLGCRVWIAPGYAGVCSANRALPESDKGRWSSLHGLFSKKGLPPREWMVFVRRHAGALWPVFWARPYFARSVRILLGKRARF